jgi:hypothetical protein
MAVNYTEAAIVNHLWSVGRRVVYIAPNRVEVRLRPSLSAPAGISMSELSLRLCIQILVVEAPLR